MDLTALDYTETVSGLLDKESYLARGPNLYEHNREGNRIRPFKTF